MKTVIEWIIANYVELVGAVLGIVYVLLAIRQNIWCWSVGIVSVAFYILIFYMVRLYGDMSLQIFYLIMGFYGWYAWFYAKGSADKLNISKIKRPILIIMFLAVVLMTPLFGYILTYTDDPIPYWDGFTTALGLVGTWMTARKYLENWLLWIFANIVCVGVYYYKELYPTVVFYAIMAVLAYRGYLIWGKELKQIKHA